MNIVPELQIIKKENRSRPKLTIAKDRAVLKVYEHTISSYYLRIVALSLKALDEVHSPEMITRRGSFDTRQPYDLHISLTREVRNGKKRKRIDPIIIREDK